MSDARSEAFAAVSVPEAYERFMSSQLFEPWARELVRRAAPPAGAAVLDVATGPGSAARLAAAAVGESGRVVACDISAAMLAVAASKPAQPGSAPIELLECSATALDCPDADFQLALCQHGLQFFPDRLAALREMRRVLAPEGLAVVSTWAAERPLGLFGPIAETLRDFGLAEPYPRAYDASSYAIGAEDLGALLRSAGFRDVSVETVELDCVWERGADALSTISGTPFGPQVAALSDDQRQDLRARLRERLGCHEDDRFAVKTASNIARGVK